MNGVLRQLKYASRHSFSLQTDNSSRQLSLPIDETKRLGRVFRSCMFQHVRQDGNRLALS